MVYINLNILVHRLSNNKGFSCSNSTVLLFVNDDITQDMESFESQLFVLNLAVTGIILFFIMISIPVFKEEKMFLISGNVNLFKGLKKLFSNCQYVLIINTMSISNGGFFLVGTVINIISVDHDFDSSFASIFLIVMTAIGMIASTIYPLVFSRVKNHSIIMCALMIFSGIFLFVVSISIFRKWKVVFVGSILLLGVTSLPIIPFLMNKTSRDFSHVSENIINIGKIYLLK